MSRLVGLRTHWLAALGVALAGVGFALHSHVGVAAALGLALAAAFAPAPFGVVFGVVAFTALFEPALAVRQLLVGCGLLALLLDSAPSMRTATGRLAVATAAIATAALAGGYSVASSTGTPSWLAAVAVGSTIALLLYAVHRYETVTLGLINR